MTAAGSASSGLGPSGPGSPKPEPSEPEPSGPATSGPEPAATSGRVTLGWTIGLILYGIEVMAVGVVSLLFGGLSVMLSDGCMPESTERICDAQWQTYLGYSAITALVVTVFAVIVLMAWTKKLWSLAVAMVATVLVPLLAFTIMEAAATA